MSLPTPAPINIPLSARFRFRDDIPVSACSSPRSIAVFSGGSAMNTFVTLLQSFTDDTAYIMPVSDDGGSTSEIIKVLGGPGIGDLRSRVVRLAETGSAESRAVHDLLSYRLPFDTLNANSPTSNPSIPTAKAVWFEILEGRHVLWQGISDPYRETIRAFLAHFQHELVKSATRRPPFEYQGGSIGNFFLTGSRLFFDNLDAAVFQFARIMRVPPRTEVVPVLATARGVVTIAAALRNGEVIVGQCDISHPGQMVPEGSRSRTGSLGSSDGKGSATLSTPPTDVPRSQPERLIPFQSLSRHPSQNLIFSKTACPSLPSAIRRIYYVNRERQEIFPDLNPLVVANLARKRTIIYGCGSLYTSILPCLVVPGVGRLLADPLSRSSVDRFSIRTSIPSPFPSRSHLSRVKLLLLNGTHDRESKDYTAMDFVLGITDALNYSCLAEERARRAVGRQPSSRSIIQEMEGSHPYGGNSNGKPISPSWWTGNTAASSDGDSGISAGKIVEMHSDSGRSYLASPHPPGAYITHLLYPEDGEVKVEVEKIESFGIRCIRVRSTGVEGSQKGHYGIDELKEVLDHLIM
ncbi:uncharacterized protein SPPG_04803 [Spizellomyces punctatus DAOM BR117]|uniref:LPPG:FO 2-phospho-L-lactate transferase CofD/UPF0052 n=1 Tax=Spizellomyces punctatus (strain DAOM BR117) TaxID=645134 RepID=A0A0L0HHD5_SPIPD|nr:uncharacterized protein SPPG_04803 [Spizellomyces punctatus DAOM BR117]KND00487.1 hypothetical protein SPPG_04803 [Spizellomyces punctatus DAOM BR117]|eukprot:XP_016608526.1 hypothetical protein SPPG_04803 [Spizellomyces punctatus DAOM BR117]